MQWCHGEMKWWGREEPHWFWYQITKDTSRPLVIDEPKALPPLVLQEILRIAREQGRDYLVIGQAEQGPQFECLWRELTTMPLGVSDQNLVWVRLGSFDGDLARARWPEAKSGQIKVRLHTRSSPNANHLVRLPMD